MKQKDIVEYTDKQLREHLEEETTSLTKLRLAHAISQQENPMKITQNRKTIARLKTEQKSRKIKAAKAQNK
jgi:large subunit ribosomal protein L29